MTRRQKPALHASTVILGRRGILVRGKSGSGKTTLCQNLIDHWSQLGKFASWVCDDQTLYEEKENSILASAPVSIAGLKENRFGGIIKIPHQQITVLDLEVCLVPNGHLDRLPENISSDRFSSLPSIKVPEKSSKIAIELISERLDQI